MSLSVIIIGFESCVGRIIKKSLKLSIFNFSFGKKQSSSSMNLNKRIKVTHWFISKSSSLRK